MQTLKNTFILGVLLLTFGCNVSPKAIEYGNDGCHFCKMTIVDKIHAAEIVTKKGKVYKFDALECMINFIKDSNALEIELYLTNHYTKPEALIDATKATFLISKNVPSPMGAFLTAFEANDKAKKIQQDKGGTLYNWNQLLDHLNK